MKRPLRAFCPFSLSGSVKGFALSLNDAIPSSPPVPEPNSSIKLCAISSAAFGREYFRWHKKMNENETNPMLLGHSSIGRVTKKIISRSLVIVIDRVLIIRAAVMVLFFLSIFLPISIRVNISSYVNMMSLYIIIISYYSRTDRI